MSAPKGQPADSGPVRAAQSRGALLLMLSMLAPGTASVTQGPRDEGVAAACTCPSWGPGRRFGESSCLAGGRTASDRCTQHHNSLRTRGWGLFLALITEEATEAPCAWVRPAHLLRAREGWRWDLNPGPTAQALNLCLTQGLHFGNERLFDRLGPARDLGEPVTTLPSFRTTADLAHGTHPRARQWRPSGPLQ